MPKQGEGGGRLTFLQIACTSPAVVPRVRPDVMFAWEAGKASKDEEAQSQILRTRDSRLHTCTPSILPTPASRKKLFPCVRQSAPGHSTPFLSDLPLTCVFICPFAPPPPPPPLPSCLLQQKRRKCASPPLLRPCHVPLSPPSQNSSFTFCPSTPIFFSWPSVVVVVDRSEKGAPSSLPLFRKEEKRMGVGGRK